MAAPIKPGDLVIVVRDPCCNYGTDLGKIRQVLREVPGYRCSGCNKPHYEPAWALSSDKGFKWARPERCLKKIDPKGEPTSFESHRKLGLPKKVNA